MERQSSIKSSCGQLVKNNPLRTGLVVVTIAHFSSLGSGPVTHMPLPSKPGRIEHTKQQYRRRTRNLVAQCRKALRLPPHEALDYRRFVGWLVTRKPEWSRDTWRQYKASVVFFLEEEAERDDVALEALDFLLPVDVSGCVRTTRKTSGKKLKKVPLKDFRAVVAYLRDRSSPWRDDVDRWISASLLTGLRPAEWARATMGVSGGEPALIVVNAKATNGRAHGITRTVLLGGLTTEERAVIAKHVERANEWEQAQQYERFYHGCAATLSRAVRNLWPTRQQRITLYSMRHQFAANAKASGYTREEIAALMGHAVDTTATAHYGKKTAGCDMVRVRPDPAEVAKIRSVFRNRFQSPSPKAQMAPSPSPKMPPSAEV